MPPIHISSTARALYRVFVAPNLHAPTSVPLHYAPAFAGPSPILRCVPDSTLKIAIRSKKYTRDTRRHALTDSYVLDNAIEAKMINLVDEEGTFHAKVPLREVMEELARTTHHLVQMTPGKVDAAGRPDPSSLPTCRIVSKMDLRAQHDRKLDLLRRQAKQSAGASTKNLELNWAIAGGDLKHRVQKLTDFLREGRKVEVLLGPKKKGKKATADEANNVLKAIQDAVVECKGARETKREGAVGAIMTIVYEGKKIEDKKVMPLDGSETV